MSFAVSICCRIACRLCWAQVPMNRLNDAPPRPLPVSRRPQNAQRAQGKIALRRAVGWVGCNHIGGQARKIMINLHTAPPLQRNATQNPGPITVPPTSQNANYPKQGAARPPQKMTTQSSKATAVPSNSQKANNSNQGAAPLAQKTPTQSSKPTTTVPSNSQKGKDPIVTAAPPAQTTTQGSKPTTTVPSNSQKGKDPIVTAANPAQTTTQGSKPTTAVPSNSQTAKDTKETADSQSPQDQHPQVQEVEPSASPQTKPHPKIQSDQFELPQIQINSVESVTEATTAL